MAEKIGGAPKRRASKKGGNNVVPLTQAPARAALPGDNRSEAEKKESAYRIRMAEVRRTRAEELRIEAVLKAAKKVSKKARDDFKLSTGINIHILRDIIKKSEMEKADLLKDAVDYNYMAEMENIPVGGQMSLIDAMEKTPVSTREAIDWEGEGWRAYGRSEECKPPAICDPIHHQSWMKGWHEHQERVAWAMRFPTLDPEPVEEPKADGADKPDEFEEFEASPDELQSQITRQQVQAAKESLDALGSGEPAGEVEDAVG